MNNPTWALWLALGLSIAGFVVWAFVLWFAVSTWRRVKPTVAPMLNALFTPAPAFLAQMEKEDDTATA